MNPLCTVPRPAASHVVSIDASAVPRLPFGLGVGSLAKVEGVPRAREVELEDDLNAGDGRALAAATVAFY